MPGDLWAAAASAWDHVEQRRRPVTLAFFAAILALGVVAFADFGIGWDETNNRQFGQAVWRHVFTGVQDQGTLDPGHVLIHGPLLEFLLIAEERALGLQDPRSIYLARHLSLFLLFWGALVSFYFISARYLDSWSLRLLACLFLLMSPRIFADAFTNTVDIGALAAFVFAFHSMLAFFERPGPGRAAFHALVCAAAIDVRLTSALVPAMTLAGLWPAITDARRGVRREGAPTLPDFALFVLLLLLFTTLFWPRLWEDPVGRLFESLDRTARFRRGAFRYPHLYLGRPLQEATPWHFNPVWMLITIPLSIVALFMASAAPALGRTLRDPRSIMAASPRVLALVAWLVLPLLGAIAMRTTLYNAWRHHFFVYPAFALLAALGLARLAAWLRARRRALVIVGALISADLALVAAFEIRNHPHQHLYFNALAGGVAGARGRFELDYWGLTVRKLLEATAAADARGSIGIDGRRKALTNNAAILPAAIRRRFQCVDAGAADYRIVYDDAGPPPEGRATPAALAVTVDGVPVAEAYRRGP